MTGPLIGRELRPAVGSDALAGPLARPGAGSKELRALAAEQLPVMGGHGGGAAGAGTDGAGWVLSAGVLEAPLDDELVLLEPTAGTYFGVNESGTAIWRALRREGSAADAQPSSLRISTSTPFGRWWMSTGSLDAWSRLD